MANVAPKVERDLRHKPGGPQEDDPPQPFDASALARRPSDANAPIRPGQKIQLTLDGKQIELAVIAVFNYPPKMT